MRSLVSMWSRNRDGVPVDMQATLSIVIRLSMDRAKKKNSNFNLHLN